ncbi:hypothetical protein [Xanthomonas phaseoli]|uniref:hypothetical protein n=1 Tax=Xanthomonas phaseoli TaxID=1985254 RepID=UPI001237C3AE|nr:hypothetical protein [Xanthomonas phaseoli]MBO9831165.1 hypothetical protein [Xanthomonas phaseoli pv. dieffenbachiae]MBO9837500.1 hypothetical protein [Xanthomonas phaseoli pv. dieffenbachiae]MBO9839260.1 hypothetical protein [Xanthomonas phaseoli pv. dieffenbachiae]MBO9861135.1 hypothetical protein [Xanthomonas phaseoli pv. dieffenbachiae]MBO9865011.1 hypothetical protein [Xanthomonas phaseoli pv. dieffenbachiae]
MTTSHQKDQAEPFFITKEVEAELIAAGHMFEPPGHASTKRLPEILASLTDDELATWPSVLSKGEIERRQVGQHY